MLWRYQTELARYDQLQQALMEQQAEQTARRIDAELNHIRNQMAAISLDNLWLQDLTRFEQVIDIQEALGERLKLYFPRMHAYVIANSHGEQIGGDIDFFVADICQRDIDHLATMFRPEVDYFDYRPYIHAKPHAYHFDVMIPVYAKGRELIFFMSFDAEILRRILANHQVSEHPSYLLRTDVDGLIEVSAEQVRDQFKRDIKLSQAEWQWIGANALVPASRWEVVVVKNQHINNAFKSKLQVDSLVIFGVLLLFWSAVFWLGLHHQNRQVRLVSKLNHLSTHDELTGLSNRRQVEREIQYAIDDVRSLHCCSVVLYMDLNGFKAVNDDHGHDIGDEVLKRFGQRLQSLTRKNDLVGRIGGDEFVVVLHQLCEPEDEEVNRILTETLDRFRKVLNRPYHINDLSLYCPPSIGVEVIDASTSDPLTVLAEADAKMYADKARFKSEL